MKAVIFDMDGVILDTHSVADEIIAQSAARHGIAMSAADYHAWHGLSGPEFWQLMCQRHALPKPAEFYLNDYDVEAEIAQYSQLGPIPGVMNLIQYLGRRDVPLGLATGGRRERMQAVLDRFGLNESFAATATRSDVARGKPAPDVYLLAAERLDVEPACCVAIEDSSHGMASALAAGMKVVWYRGHSREQQPQATPHLVAHDLSHVTVDHLLRLLDD